MSLKAVPDSFRGLRITVMGLGLHGGGAASAAFFAEAGAKVTVTDLRSKAVLTASLKKLEPHPIRYVLGRHVIDDFSDADMVIKNPAVPENSPYLAKAKRIETDISIFLSLFGGPVIAVTGTKGKSTTASAIHHGLKKKEPGAKLGGNITVSPLTFLKSVVTTPQTSPVVLELSSWQLADLRGREALKPKVAIITNIYRDHFNRYDTMESYVNDKAVVFAGQSEQDYTILNYDSGELRALHDQCPARVLYVSSNPLNLDGAWIEGAYGMCSISGRKNKILPDKVSIPGPHNRMNLLTAALCLRAFGFDATEAGNLVADFPGLEHRLEFVPSKGVYHFYNDSAATIPEATVMAAKSMEHPVVLITGGTDKNLDFQVFKELAFLLKACILLDGSSSEKITRVLDSNSIPYEGPFPSLDMAVRKAIELADPGDSLLMSPGCASFEMFLNEFDRGRRFKSLIREMEY